MCVHASVYARVSVCACECVCVFTLIKAHEDSNLTLLKNCGG